MGGRLQVVNARTHGRFPPPPNCVAIEANRGFFAARSAKQSEYFSLVGCPAAASAVQGEAKDVRFKAHNEDAKGAASGITPPPRR